MLGLGGCEAWAGVRPGQVCGLVGCEAWAGVRPGRV